MNPTRFNEIVTKRLTTCEAVLCKKADEYASDTDRLHNFKRAAAMTDTTPEKALEGMWVKHLVSVQDLINFPDRATLESIAEKMGDTINYVLLLEAILMERMDGRVEERREPARPIMVQTTGRIIYPDE
ncbi:MAG: hypothetical protein PF495_17285 [Spirochaetales bacterium]|jgi:hypothetical protein|nr:hypothetical protein [Spirochaetales bacterium]